MLYFAELAKKKKFDVVSIISQRHADEIFNKTKFENALKKFGKVYKLNKLDNTSLKKIIDKKKNILFFSFDSPWIFQKKIIKDIFDDRLINTHSTRLPLNRGGGGFSLRIMNQEKLGTCILHMISSGKIDEGNIIFQDAFIFPHSLKKPIEYSNFQLEKEKVFLNKFITKIADNKKFELVGQPEYLSSYFPRLYTKQNGWIDWTMINIDLFNFICAFDEPYDGASTYYENSIVKIKSVTWTRSDHNFHPYQYGLIYRKSKNWIVVAINGGSLIIEEVLDQKNKNLINEIKPGGRFITPSKKIDDSKLRIYYTPQGLKK